MSRKILVVEDEEEVRLMVQRVLEREGYQVETANDGLMGEEKLRQEEFDLLITDIIMPEKEGIELIMLVRRSSPDIKILAISGGGRGTSMDYLSMAKSLGADQVLGKPFERALLVETVKGLFGDAA